jgi:hypothetical protein
MILVRVNVIIFKINRKLLTKKTKRLRAYLKKISGRIFYHVNLEKNK